MTNEEAARILDPATSAEALRPYELDCVMRMAVVEEACRMGAEALRTENALRLEAVKDISTDRLHELAEADRAGRLVVLPCKVGDKKEYPELFKCDISETVESCEECGFCEVKAEKETLNEQGCRN